MKKDFRKYVHVVDDSPDTQLLMTMLLAVNGYKVKCTGNGQEALALLCVENQTPDLIILDSRMPVMNGEQFLIAQKNDPLLKDIPVILMSGGNDFLKSKCETTQKILSKPIQVKTLLACISGCLSPETRVRSDDGFNLNNAI